MSSTFYRTSDNVDNFKLKVSIREIGRLVLEKGSKADEPFTDDIVLSWQQKMYGPSDIAGFLKNREHKPKNRAEQDVRRQLQQIEEQGKSLASMLKPVMLYTYTDKDVDMPQGPVPVNFSTEDTIEPYLASVNGSGAAAGEREKKVRDRLLREKPSKVMHVCLATDVNVKALQDKDFWDPRTHYTEHLLCSVKVFSDGLVEMSPALSPAMEEGLQHKGHSQNKVASASLFMSDETVATSLKKGLRVATSRVRSKAGADFEYCLSNPNDLFNPQQLEDKRKSTLAADAVRSRNVRGDADEEGGANSWRQDPPSTGFDKSIAFYGEIVSGTGFAGDKVFVDYEVLVPDGWNMRTGNLSDGIGEEDLIKTASAVSGIFGNNTNNNTNNKDGMSKMGMSVTGGASEKTDASPDQAAAAKLMQELDGYADGEEAQGMLHGVTQIATPKEQRGGLSLPTLRPHWRGQRLPFTLSATSRITLALAYTLFEALSLVFFNIQYPFFLLSALIIYFTIGSGYEGGHQQAIIDKDGKGKGSGLSKKRHNRRLEGGLVAEYAAHFNHLVNMSFDCKDESRMGFNGISGDSSTAGYNAPVMTPSAYAPTVVFTVYSIGAFGLINVEGYSYLHLPNKPGSIDATIKCWRPLGGINAEMRSFFLGASPHLADKESMYATGQGNKKSRISSLNMFGVSSENSGEIRFRCNVLVTDPRKKSIASDANKPMDQSSKSMAVSRTVDDILKNYRSGVSLGKSVEMSTGSSGVSGIANLSSKTNVGSSIDSNLLSKKAELLIAQARSRVIGKGTGGLSSSMGALSGMSGMGGSGSGSSRLGSLVGGMGSGMGNGSLLSSVREGAKGEGKAEDEDTPLLATMTRPSNSESKTSDNGGRYDTARDEEL